MKFVNLTNRNINNVDRDGRERLSLKPSGIVVGVSVIPKLIEVVYEDDGHMGVRSDEFEVVTYVYSGVSNLPAPEAGVMYVVSYAVLQALNGKRSDVIAPDTAPTSIVRDGQRVLGVQKFRKL